MNGRLLYNLIIAAVLFVSAAFPADAQDMKVNWGGTASALAGTGDYLHPQHRRAGS